jgi:23S rRNA (cytosine1962-C5)-methyltransferase
MFDISGWVKLGKDEDHRIRNGHLWVYRSEIAATGGSPAAGDIVWVKDTAGRRLGLGTFNPNSVISVRLLGRGAKATFTRETFSDRLKTSIRRRAHLGFDARRLVNAEGDHLPGLIVDAYADVVVVQLQIACWEQRKQLVIDELDRMLGPKAVVVRNESPARKLEGLDLYTEIARGTLTGHVPIREAALELEVDVLAGQKTGFYIDQRHNRRLCLPFVDGSRVLDCFCYTGAWSLMAARAGAGGVLGLDYSQAAVDLAERNARLNHLEPVATFRTADVFDSLPRLAADKEKFDIVILDPPSLARTKRAVAGAERGYVHLNRIAMGLIGAGGFLVTCSCSHHVTGEHFRRILQRSASLAKKRVAILRMGSQPEDHPSLLGLPESEYLKCLLLRVE